MVFVYRARDGPDTQVVPIKGLDPAASYSIVFVDTKVILKGSGLNFLTNGVKVTLPEFSAQVLEIIRI